MLNFFKKRWYVVLFFILLISYLVWQTQLKPTEISGAKSYKVKRQTLKDELSLSGEIDAEEKVMLRFQTSGRLAWVGVKEGDYVKKNQAVASLDQREVGKNLEKALRDYSKERWDFEEDKEVTYKSSVKTDTARRILEKNQFDLEKAVMDVELKQLAVELSTLISPIEGMVIRVASPFAGVNVTPTQAEFEIVNPKTVFFSAMADQTEVVQLKEGKQGEIILDAYLEDQTKGEIKKISFIPKEGETGTVYEIRIYFDKDNSDYRFRIGMTGDVNFVLRQRKNVLAIPTSYLKTEGSKKYVWRLENKKRVKTFVILGDEVDGTIVVKTGLSENDMIQD